MAMQDNNRVAWTYTTNDNEAFRISAKACYVLDVTDGAKYGGTAAAGSMRALPSSFRPRRVACVNTASGVTRWVIAYTTAAAIWTTVGTSITLNLNGADVAFLSSADRRDERYGRSTKQQS